MSYQERLRSDVATLGHDIIADATLFIGLITELVISYITGKKLDV